MSELSSQKLTKGQRTREKIVRVAAQMFNDDGFGVTSLRQIAAACDMTHPGLLYHFANKEALLVAVLEWRDAEELATFRRNGSQAANGLNILRGMVDLARQNSSEPGMVELFTTLSGEATAKDHPAHDYFVKRYRRIRSGIARALEQVRDAGYLRPGVEISDVSHELTALQDGLQVQWLLDPENVDISGILERRINQLLTVEL